MGNFHHGADRNKGRKEFTKKPFEMHKAVCSDCGNNCEVPFKPSNEKPVFCNDCFGSKREERGTKERYISTPRRDDRREERQEFSKPVQAQVQVVTVKDEETKVQYFEIMTKLDRVITLLEASFSKPESVEVAKQEVVKVKKVEATKTVTKKAPVKQVPLKSVKVASKVATKKKK